MGATVKSPVNDCVNVVYPALYVRRAISYVAEPPDRNKLKRVLSSNSPVIVPSVCKYAAVAPNVRETVTDAVAAALFVTIAYAEAFDDTTEHDVMFAAPAALTYTP